MLPFTFLILRKPCIASLVRSFTFRGRFHDEDYSSSHPSERRLLWPKHPERDNILRRLIKKISHSEEEELEWHQAVLPGIAPQDDAICSLLLISLPNLRRLDFEITGYHVDFLTRIFSRIASSEPPFDVNPVFTKLSDIMLAGSNDRYSTDYVLLGACCNFPAIKRLYGHRLGADEDRPQLSALGGATSPIETSELHDSKPHLGDRSQLSGRRSPTSQIETLELRDSKLHLDDLPIIFGTLRTPQTLIYHIGNP